MHVINEYCRPDRSFYPCPQFTEEMLPRTRAFCDKNDWFNAKHEDGFLGEKFAVQRSNIAKGAHPYSPTQWSRGNGGPSLDLQAVQSLSKTRTQQLELLASQLKPASSMSMK